MITPGSANPLLFSADEGYNLTRSLRFRSSASAYLSRTPASSGTLEKWTQSLWVKRGALGAFSYLITNGANNSNLGFASSDVLDFYEYTGSSVTMQLTTTQVFRDPSAWYHIVLAVDTTQATASNRVKIYVNGSQVTAFSTASYPAQNTQTYWNRNLSASIGAWNGASGRYLDGYLTEVNFIDGQALTPSSFGSTNTLTGVWQPARYVGTYGTNGFYLPFTDNSALTTSSNAGLGKDLSGNGNYWTTNNISITAGTTYDSMTDVPTLTSATVCNYPTFNPLAVLYGTPATKNGNLATNAGGIVSGSTMLFPTTGKFYVEFTITALSNLITVGLCNSAPSRTQYLEYTNSGTKTTTSGPTSYGASYTTGDVIGMAVDCTNSQVTFYKNNTSQGVLALSVGSLTVNDIQSQTYTNASGDVVSINFGQQPFTYTPPTGYVALNTYNLPTGTILKGNTVMDATIWTGDGTSPRTITNASGFKPDLVWFKSRSTTYYHQLADSVRGATKSIYSNVTNAEENNAINGYLSSINSNGFSVINGSTSGGSVNANGTTYVAWQWQAGQGTTSTNTSGTISATVSVNASAGFSVVTYTGNGSAGATLGHGLGVAPSLIFIKSLSATGYWIVYSSVNGATKYLTLNTTDAVLTNAGPFNNTAPTSSVFSVGSSADVNTNGTTYVAYCFAPIAGYSAFGSLTTNGSADNAFVYTGFKPRWIMWKRTDGANAWGIVDTARSTYNVTGPYLLANASDAEGTATLVDILSNGFKFRDSGFGAGQTYIYAAFAEVPFRNSLAR